MGTSTQSSSPPLNNKKICFVYEQSTGSNKERHTKTGKGKNYYNPMYECKMVQKNVQIGVRCSVCRRRPVCVENVESQCK